MVAPLAGSVDRNPRPSSRCAWRAASLPSRGAWIEIKSRDYIPAAEWGVAPLAGSVDRNTCKKCPCLSSPVAPLAGSVDRNSWGCLSGRGPERSLPSRGAWIEIRMCASQWATW